MNWSHLHARLHQQLKRSALLPKDTSIIIAVSGGQDSICLGQLLLDLRKHWHWSLAIAHCHHGWPGDSAIAQHVKQLAMQWQLPFYLSQAEQGLPETENAARQWRYQALCRVARELAAPYIVTGHTQTDRAETLLYNLARGSGTAGLSSLREQRPLGNDLNLVRPLLKVARSETKDFCQLHSLPIIEDPYNKQLRFKRNQVRQLVFPQLQRLHGQAEKHLAQTAQILEDETNYLEAIAEQQLHQALHQNGELYRQPLKFLHTAIKRRVMRQYLASCTPKMPSFMHINAATDLITAPNRQSLSTLPGGLQLQVRDEWIVPLLNHRR